MTLVALLVCLTTEMMTHKRYKYRRHWKSKRGTRKRENFVHINMVLLRDWSELYCQLGKFYLSIYYLSRLARREQVVELLIVYASNHCFEKRQRPAPQGAVWISKTQGRKLEFSTNHRDKKRSILHWFCAIKRVSRLMLMYIVKPIVEPPNLSFHTCFRY